MDWNLIGYIGVILGSVVGAVWSMAIWLGRQFLQLSKAIIETKDAIIDKLEYHERHDDSRFSDIHKDIWEIRLRNAAIDAISERDARIAERKAIAIEKQQKEDLDERS